MGRHGRPEVHRPVVSGHDVQDTRRQDLVHQFHCAQGRQRGQWRWLDHYGIARAQGRQDMPDRDHDREIPRCDRSDHTKRLAVQFNPPGVVVLKHLDRKR